MDKTNEQGLIWITTSGDRQRQERCGFHYIRLIRFKILLDTPQHRIKIFNTLILKKAVY